jgi:hypothetical protein
MKRPLACLIAATLCLGCQAPPGAIDPFIGRQTVPPPGTGTPSSVPPGDEYYNGAPKASANDASPSGTPYSPPGGFRSPNNAATKPEAIQPRAAVSGSSGNSGGSPVRPASPTDTPPGTTASRGTTGSGFVNTNPTRGLPQAKTASTRSSTSPATSGPRPATSQPIKDIKELPDAKSPASRDSSGFRKPTGTIRASYEEEVQEIRDSAKSSSRTPRREPIAPGKYEADRNYRWLKGKLEYTRSDDRWKLRYIPIDGDTDNFGGSVVLLGSRLLEGYKPGEYVTVHGTLGETDSRGTGFAPSYTVDRVTRQAEE